MAWFKRDSDPNKTAADASAERTVKTEGLWLKCEGCREIIWKKDLELTMNVCGKCGYHFRVDARTRLILLFDDGKYLEHDAELASSDPLNFVDQKSYVDRLKAMQLATSLKDALISGSGTLAGRPVNICAMEPKFIGGSMGSVMGEKITRAVEHRKHCYPVGRGPIDDQIGQAGHRKFACIRQAAGTPQTRKIGQAFGRRDDCPENFLGRCGIIQRDIGDDTIQITRGGFGENQSGQSFQPCFAAISPNTSSAGRTRPSFAASIPARMRSACQALASR